MCVVNIITETFSLQFNFQNTREVYAVCVYAGTQTKISLNSKITKNKFSSIERSLNKYVYDFTLLFICHDITCTQVPDSLHFDPAHRNDCQVCHFTVVSQKKTQLLILLSQFQHSLLLYPWLWILQGDRPLPLQVITSCISDPISPWKNTFFHVFSLQFGLCYTSDSDYDDDES